MAYPFTPCPKYEVFLEQLASQGVTIKERTVMLDDKSRNIQYLERVDGGKTYYHPLGFAAEGDPIQFQVIRSVCKALKIDPAVFGLTLG